MNKKTPLLVGSILISLYSQAAPLLPSLDFRPYMVGDNLIAYVNVTGDIVLAQINKNKCSDKEGEITYEDSFGRHAVTWARKDNDRNYQIVRYLCNSGARQVKN